LPSLRATDSGAAIQLLIPKNGVKYRTDSHAPVNASTDKVPYRRFDLFEGHYTISFTTKNKNAPTVITVLATADQIMIL